MNASTTDSNSRRSACSLSRRSWNPYIAGVGIGILSWILFLVVDKPLGMSTEVSKVSGWVVQAFGGGDYVADNAYWAEKTPKFGYSTIFLIFTAVGAFLSSRASRSFRTELVPQVWKDQFGERADKRFLAAFLGGAILLFGARMAGGCTSGHGISGTLQLAVSGWLFFAAMFIGGTATAKLLFRK